MQTEGSISRRRLMPPLFLAVFLFLPAPTSAAVLYSQPVDTGLIATTSASYYLRSFVTPSSPDPLFGWASAFGNGFPKYPLGADLAWSGELGDVSFKVPGGFNTGIAGLTSGNVIFYYGTTTTGTLQSCDAGQSIYAFAERWHYPTDYDAASGTITVDFSSQHIDVSLWKCAFVSIDTPVYGDWPHIDTRRIEANAQGDAYLIIENNATTTPSCTQNCNSNILFLPGIEASRLYRPQVVGDPDKRLWEPGLHDDLHDLYLTPEGRSVRDDVYTKVGDVIDETPVGANIYKSFIAKMDDLKTGGKIVDWESAPYDWRLSLDDILAHGTQAGQNISYLTATDTPYIVQELKRLAATSRTGKVSIVAHSNGGLVAKRLTELLGADASKLIDRMIFVAVPQAGTPAAAAALLHGHDQAIAHGIVVDEAAARTFASTSPMTYQLLPSAKYFTYVDDPVISFDASLPDWIARYGSTIHSQERLHNFLVDTYGRVDAQTGDIDQPIQANGTLLTGAEALHTDLDDWTPPTGVRLIQVAGWGVPTTVSGIAYKKKDTGIKPYPQFTVDGDGTVVVPSALWMSTTTVADYWMDLKTYNKRPANQIAFGFLSKTHGDILEVSELLDFLSDNIANTTKPITAYTYLSTETPHGSGTRLRYSLHSPLTISFYDDLGHHTGISTTTGQVEEQIPGTYYMEFGEVKYIFTDASTTAHIVMNGYDTGAFTFNVDEYAGDSLTASTTFKDIPTTASTTVSLDIQSDISTLSPMKIDKNGDGTVDATVAPKLNGTVILDTIPPEITITFATSTNSLVFIGTDDVSTTTITSTTAYPVLKKHEKETHGIATTTIIARDEAGNTTALVYTEKLPSPDRRDTITLKEIAYNGATTTIASTTLSYKWRQNKDTSYTLFASHLATSATSTESHYRPTKDITVIMTKPRELDYDDSDDDANIRPIKETLLGMVVPYVRTEEGRMIIISY